MVKYEVDGAVVTVTIDRPAVRNAVDPDTAEALRAAFLRFDSDPKLSVAPHGGGRHLLRRLRPEGAGIRHRIAP